MCWDFRHNGGGYFSGVRIAELWDCYSCRRYGFNWTIYDVGNVWCQIFDIFGFGLHLSAVCCSTAGRRQKMIGVWGKIVGVRHCRWQKWRSRHVVHYSECNLSIHYITHYNFIADLSGLCWPVPVTFTGISWHPALYGKNASYNISTFLFHRKKIKALEFEQHEGEWKFSFWGNYPSNILHTLITLIQFYLIQSSTSCVLI